MAIFGFPKSEHLCLQRDIDALFAEPDGTATAWPVRCIWKSVSASEQSAPLKTQVLISVAKRHLHHAVDRNRAKRQIREAYRLQKHMLTPQQSTLTSQLPTYHIAFIWLADTPQPSAKVHHSLHKLLAKISSPNK